MALGARGFGGLVLPSSRCHHCEFWSRAVIDRIRLEVAYRHSGLRHVFHVLPFRSRSTSRIPSRVSLNFLRACLLLPSLRVCRTSFGLLLIRLSMSLVMFAEGCPKFFSSVFRDWLSKSACPWTT